MNDLGRVLEMIEMDLLRIAVALEKLAEDPEEENDNRISGFGL